ncbi:hypothetical protein JXD38_05575 [candidate division WOR-3 bacterium]|nr:hypothetical protein [candidate division WOR-3 bacterium]
MVKGRTGRKEAAAVKIVHLSDLHFSSEWFAGAETEVDIVLAGHGHVPHFCSHGHTQFVTAGAATLWRTAGGAFPSFNFVTIQQGMIWMQLVDVSGGWGTQTIATAKLRREVAPHRVLPRITPPFAFEAEKFGSHVPEENWRHRLGIPQVLDFPPLRG